MDNIANKGKSLNILEKMDDFWFKTVRENLFGFKF